MKLDDAACFSTSGSHKRKCDFDADDRRAKRPLMQPRVVVDVDVLQARVQQNRIGSQMLGRRGNHAVMYPVNCDPIDGVSPNLHAMQVNRTVCARCLQGEPGHFRHILEK
ncbi:uncharacterized protein LOC122251764 isoform X2 [Penaeus japonicus]|uniref:uncharacterized protein LOC122251764 isoform X2 n=1 Tax=Penaeus japonicus TaxID=27405 RepID=UPI001C716703|nr:uncharacterized protein LOC122251764 isoform X2 [Penaeus japonicus]